MSLAQHLDSLFTVFRQQHDVWFWVIMVTFVMMGFNR